MEEMNEKIQQTYWNNICHFHQSLSVSVNIGFNGNICQGWFDCIDFWLLPLIFTAFRFCARSILYRMISSSDLIIQQQGSSMPYTKPCNVMLCRATFFHRFEFRNWNQNVAKTKTQLSQQLSFSPYANDIIIGDKELMRSAISDTMCTVAVPT